MKHDCFIGGKLREAIEKLPPYPYKQVKLASGLPSLVLLLLLPHFSV
jgi:hypothetical protein